MLTRKTLGLAFTGQSLLIVEVATARGRHSLLRSAELPLTDTATLQEPATLGAALKALLRRNRFSASRCVIGLPASQLASREKRLPVAAANSLADILSIATEQDFAADPGELAFDYLPWSDARTTGALLAAASRKSIDPLVATVQAAGLKVAGITASCLALALASAQPAARERLVLLLSPTGAELVALSANSVRQLRWLPVQLVAGNNAAAQRSREELRGELQRILSASLAQGQGESPELLVWNMAQLTEEDITSLGASLSVGVRSCGFPDDIPGFGKDSVSVDCQFAPAAALAIHTGKSQAPSLDFLHSRLAPRSQRKIGRVAVWASIAAAVAILAGVMLLLDWRSDRRQADELHGRLDEMSRSVAQAKDVMDRATFARGWYDRRPKFLECLKATTLAFPEDGKVWATNLSVTEDMHTQLTGKAADETAALSLLDRLKSNPALTEVKPNYIRQAGANSHDVSFEISFCFVGVNP